MDFKRMTPMFALAVATVVMGACGASQSDDGAAAQASGPADGSQVVARVGDRSITMDELDRKTMTLGIEPFQALYDARRGTLDGMIAEHLFQKEAAKRGITEDELMQTEITGKVTPVTDAEIQDFYNQNRNRIRGTVEEVGPQIRQFLQNQKLQQARDAFVTQLKQGMSIDVDLDPPRIPIEVAADDASWGPVDAPVQIVEFSDFQCPFCSRVTPTLKQIKDAYGDKVRIVFRHLPLQMHPEAVPAAIASECAREQDKFWPYHDKLFENQRALAAADLKRYAEEVGLDKQQFDQCLDTGKYRDDVMQDMQTAQQLGINGTPAFFINGRFLNGAVPFEQFKQVIDEELAG